MVWFKCSNSNEHITYPNFVLINKPIANIHRSPDQWDAIEFQILANTSLEKLSILRNRIDKYVRALLKSGIRIRA
jgi:small-conductance mechanosensitive channel